MPAHSKVIASLSVPALAVTGLAIWGTCGSSESPGAREEVPPVPITLPEPQPSLLALSQDVSDSVVTREEPPKTASDSLPSPLEADPCSLDLANATFSTVRSLLECSDPSVKNQAAKFIDEISPDPVVKIPDNITDAFTDDFTNLLNEAEISVRAGLGDLTRRSPDRVITNQDLNSNYVATRWEVHPDNQGQLQAMMVEYTGQTGQAYIIPKTEAGKRLAFWKIQMYKNDNAPIPQGWIDLYSIELEPKEAGSSH